MVDVSSSVSTDVLVLPEKPELGEMLFEDVIEIGACCVLCHKNMKFSKENIKI